jgi:hypothetical protein
MEIMGHVIALLRGRQIACLLRPHLRAKKQGGYPCSLESSNVHEHVRTSFPSQVITGLSKQVSWHKGWEYYAKDPKNLVRPQRFELPTYCS